ncbi:MAG: hypothetical protein Q8O15_11140 [Rectinemataceae bacterium]|nr:hypothetical protein [Rectinemataceae bacterium]
MKKFLVVLLALVAVGGAFAQTPALTFGMYGDITAKAATLDSYGIYTETYLTYKAKDMGLNATVIGGADFFATPRNYKFWYQVCSAAKISAGVLRETGSARLTSYIDGNGFSTRMANVEAGVLAEMNLLKGVTLAAFAPVTGVAPLTDLQKSAFGVSLALPNLATVVASYRLNGYEAAAGVDLKVIKGITLKAGFKNTGTLGAATVIYGTFGQSANGLNFGADAAFVMKPTSGYSLKGMVEYTIGSYVLGAKASIDNGNAAAYQSNNALVLNPYVKRNFAAGDIKVGATYNAGTSVITMPVDFEISF